MEAPAGRIRRILSPLAIGCLFSFASCGVDDGLGSRYSVTGEVTYNDKPLEKGLISFVPEDGKGIGANGTVLDGSYAMSTVGDRDGVKPGRYKVTITSKEDTYAKAQEDFKKTTKQEGDGIVPARFLVKAAASAKDFLPAGYGDVRSTTLMAEVPEKSSKINFKLSDAEAPPPPQASGKAKGVNRR